MVELLLHTQSVAGSSPASTTINMAKTFSSIKKSLGLLDIIQFGKYRGCRVDSIVDMDDKYISYLQAQGVKFDKEVTLAVSNKVQILDTTINAEDDATYFDDVPF